MINPFQSIGGTLEPPAGHQDGPFPRSSFEEAALAANSAPPKEEPFGCNGLPAVIETGLSNLLLPSAAASVSVLPQQGRKPLDGGTYSPSDALALMNSHYLIGRSEQEIAIFRIKDDGLLAFTPPEQFKLDVANIFVRPSSRSSKPIPVEKFWKESPQRNEKTIVFRPGGVAGPHETTFGAALQSTRAKDGRNNGGYGGTSSRSFAVVTRTNSNISFTGSPGQCKTQTSKPGSLSF